MSDIKRNVEAILSELPSGVELVAAAKTRTAAEIREAVNAGVKFIGENYVQEAAAAFTEIGREVRWHFIGHLQKNKVKHAVEIFDMIETVDSEALASEIDKRSAAAGKMMEVLIEVNSGREPQKSGAMPEAVPALAGYIASLANVELKGLMTMGPLTGEPEDSRRYFVETKKVFDELKAAGIPGVEMKYLSMGMTGSYRVAIEEGANLVRIGTGIFGDRK
jgi:pyridoxal phosphate enzyme (YggS family)